MFDGFRRSYCAIGRSVAIAFATLLIAAAPLPNKAQQGRPPIAEQRADINQNTTKSHSSAPQPPGTSKRHPVYVEAKCEHGCGYSEDRSWTEKLWTDPVATFTGLLAILTLGLIGTGLVQVYWMGRTVSDATAQHIVSNRAFVFLEDYDASFTVSTIPGVPMNAQFGSELRIVPKWKNSGNTPTKNLSLRVASGVIAGEIPADFGYPYADNAIRTIIGPNANEWNRPITIPMHNAQRAAQGHVNIYVWGRADYRDVFEGTPPRFTEFCSRLHVFATRDDVKAQFTPYGAYNRTEADEASG